MTSPYPPPSNQPGGDGWGGDLNSPFGPSTPGDQVSPYGAPPPQQSNESQEPSPYEGVQYELDAQTPPPAYPPMSGPPNSGPPGGPPNSGPPGYGPPPPPGYGPPPGGAYPPPPPQKSGSNTGLIVGGVIGGVVLLMVLAVAAVFIIVDDSGSDRADGSGEESSEESGEDALAYRLNSDPCSSVKSDVEAIGEIDGSFDSNGHGSEYGYGNCFAIIEKSADDYENYGYFTAAPNVYEAQEEAKTGYETSKESELGSGCETSDLSGAWEQGTVANCSSGSSLEETVIVVQDANIEMAISLDITGDLGVDDPKGTLESMTEKILDDLKA